MAAIDVAFAQIGYPPKNILPPQCAGTLLITSVAPSQQDALVSETVTVRGYGFVSGATVTVGGVTVGTNWVDQTHLTFSVPTTLAVGTRNDVTVTNPTAATTMASAWIVNFADVPRSHPFNEHVVKLYKNGVTGGCASGSFCPSASATHAQMAVFLLRSKLGGTFVAPPATGMFTDVSDPFFEAMAEALARAGISTSAERAARGCTNQKNFCPNSVVSRAQMAPLLLLAKHGPDYVPPLAVGIFSDVPVNDFYAPWVEQLARDGITTGCTTSSFCPNDPVTRGQMAAFLARTFELP